jgi:SET domain-containing protein
MLIEFRLSSIHGQGGFALTDLAKDQRIIEYKGRLISKQESLKQCQLKNPFIFFLNSAHDLDGDVSWNPARWLNHSCQPNAEAVLIEERIWIVANRAIRAGEEITFNYGYDLDSYRDYPCQCGSTNCVGYILAEEFHSVLRKPQA